MPHRSRDRSPRRKRSSSADRRGDRSHSHRDRSPKRSRSRSPHRRHRSRSRDRHGRRKDKSSRDKAESGRNGAGSSGTKRSEGASGSGSGRKHDRAASDSDSESDSGDSRRRHKRRHKKKDSKKKKHKSSKKDAKKKKKHKSSKKDDKGKDDKGKDEDAGFDASSSDESFYSSDGELESWQISKNDYFARATEFRVWLKLHKKVMFEDLSSKEAHRLFKRTFVSLWNARKLDDSFYNGLPPTVLESVKRTKHKWGFAKKMSSKDKFKLDSLKDSVAVTTNKGGPGAGAGGAGAGAGAGGKLPKGPRRPAAIGPSMPPHVGPARRPASAAERHARFLQEKADRQRYHDRVKANLDELAPKATGREAIVEKRRAAAARIHGAARERDANADGLDLPESFTFGTGTDKAFAAQVERERRRRESRAAEAYKRGANALKKEEERMAAFKASLGIKPGMDFRIRPRED